jgi:hypothetical protein
MSSPVSYDLQGQGGGQVLSVNDVATATNLRWVQCITDCVFGDFTSSNIAGISELEGETIPAGIGIGGRLETVTITSGLAIGYKL